MRKYPLIKAGDRFGAWLSLSDQHRGDKKILCRCTECGIIKPVDITSLNSGASTHCHKCGVKKRVSGTNSDIHVGDKFFHWTVIKNMGRIILCECDCKNKTRREIPGKYLLRGETKSCGCKRGESQSKGQRIGKEIGLKIMNEIHAAGLYPSYEKKTNKNSSTGITGVSINRRDGKYRAYISVDHKSIHLGLYDTLDEAAKARKEAEEKYFSDRKQRVEEIKSKFIEGEKNERK
jgi:hypothetical protein